MTYNWLQALEMVANGQPMHVKEQGYYIKNEKGAIYYCNKYDDMSFNAVIITSAFMNTTFEPYHKQIELTEDEKVILRNVDGIYKYICRDKSNELFLYEHKPTKKENIWAPTSRIIRTFGQFNHLFQGIQWEDEEPRLIADLIK